MPAEVSHLPFLTANRKSRKLVYRLDYVRACKMKIPSESGTVVRNSIAVALLFACFCLGGLSGTVMLFVIVLIIFGGTDLLMTVWGQQNDAAFNWLILSGITGGSIGGWLGVYTWLFIMRKTNLVSPAFIARISGLGKKG